MTALRLWCAWRPRRSPNGARLYLALGGLNAG
jgi:hypothetical protein